MDLTIVIDCKEQGEVEHLLSLIPDNIEVILCGINPVPMTKSYPGLSWEQAWRYASGDHILFLHSGEPFTDLTLSKILKLGPDNSYSIYVNGAYEPRLVKRSILLHFSDGLPQVESVDSGITLDEVTMHGDLRSALAFGDLDIANSLVSGLMADLDGDLSGMMRMANMLVAKESYNEARKLLEKMLKHDERFPGLHSRLGLVCNEMADYAIAKNYLLKALSSDPHDSVVLHELGRSCQGLGEMMRAIDYYNQSKLAEKF